MCTAALVSRLIEQVLLHKTFVQTFNVPSICGLSYLGGCVLKEESKGKE
jgi:hypothetical protein